MKRAYRFVLAALGVVCLASCADTIELYPGDAYVSPDFLANRYHDSPSSFGSADIVSAISLENGKGGYFNGSGEYDSPRKCRGFDQAKSFYPEYFQNEDGSPLYWLDPSIASDILDQGIGKYVDQTPLYGTVYSQTKKLSRLHKGFSKGYLSKLYNGQIRCDGWSYYSLVLLDKEGYGTMFPSELKDATYFAFSARGGRDSDDSQIGNVVSFDIGVTFYRYKEDGKTVIGESVSLQDVKLQANYSAEYTSLVGFNFADAGISPRGIIGMSMSVQGLDDPYMDGKGNRPSYDFTDNAEIHTGLCLLEVLIPDSTWF